MPNQQRFVFSVIMNLSGISYPHVLGGLLRRLASQPLLGICAC
jgi:hypothetical protein